MLVLGRKQGESIRIGTEIEVTIVGISGNRVRVGIKAPDHVRVLRQELEQHEDVLSPAANSAPPAPVSDRRSVA